MPIADDFYKDSTPKPAAAASDEPVEGVLRGLQSLLDYGGFAEFHRTPVPVPPIVQKRVLDAVREAFRSEGYNVAD
jgi:hypothetical protein